MLTRCWVGKSWTVSCWPDAIGTNVWRCARQVVSNGTLWVSWKIQKCQWSAKGQTGCHWGSESRKGILKGVLVSRTLLDFLYERLNYHSLLKECCRCDLVAA